MPLAAEDSLTGAPGDGLRQWLVPGCSCGIERGVGGEFSDKLTYLVWGCLKELECFSHFLLPLTAFFHQTVHCDLFRVHEIWCGKDLYLTGLLAHFIHENTEV